MPLARSGRQASPDEFRALELRAHSLLAGVELHDVWRIDLPPADDGSARSVDDLRVLFSFEELQNLNPVVLFLFALRSWLGKLFRLDAAPTARDRSAWPAASFLHKLSALEGSDAIVSRVEAGTPEGPFTTLYVTQDEALSEILNATVHAFLLLVLRRAPEAPGQGYVAYWAVYVRPVGRITKLYMALIDPFRRFLVYPAILAHVERRWRARFAPGRTG